MKQGKLSERQDCPEMLVNTLLCRFFSIADGNCNMFGEQPNRNRIESGVVLTALRPRAGGPSGVVTVRFDLLCACCFATGDASSEQISVWRFWRHTVILT